MCFPALQRKARSFDLDRSSPRSECGVWGLFPTAGIPNTPCTCSSSTQEKEPVPVWKQGACCCGQPFQAQPLGWLVRPCRQGGGSKCEERQLTGKCVVDQNFFAHIGIPSKASSVKRRLFVAHLVWERSSYTSSAKAKTASTDNDKSARLPHIRVNAPLKKRRHMIHYCTVIVMLVEVKIFELFESLPDTMKA
jgi:hypothetical protein